MRKTTERYTKSLLSVAALLCVLLLAGCDGPLTDEDLSMSLLKGKSDMGLSLLEDEDEGGASGAAKALVGTWLEANDKGEITPPLYGFTFKADGTYYVYDHNEQESWFWELWPGEKKNEKDLTAADIPMIITTTEMDGPTGTYSVRGNIITEVETYVDDGKVVNDTNRVKYVLNGNTLLLYWEYDGDGDKDHGEVDEDGDGFIDTPEYILTKYN